MENKEEIQINIPGQILDYVGTQEKLLKLFKYIKELQRQINLLKTSCDESQEVICDYAKENKKLKEELQQEKKDFKETNDYCFELKDYKSRNEKAIEYMENYIEVEDAPINERIKIEFEEILKKLKGE